MTKEREHEIRIRFTSSERMAECVYRGLLRSDWVRDMDFTDDEIILDEVRSHRIGGDAKWAVLKLVMEVLDDPTVDVDIDYKIGADWGRDRAYVYSGGKKITIESFTTTKLDEEGK